MKKILLGSMLLLFCWLGAEDLRPYRLINADVGTAIEQNEQRILKLSGNVHFFYGETEFFSNTAELYDEEELTILQGEVEVYEDSLALFADKVEYFRLQEKLVLTGSVLAREEHADSTYRTFAADKVIYWRQKQELDAEANVVMYDQREQVDGTCGILHYNRQDGYGYLLQRPQLALQDSLKISAEKIEYFEEFSKVTANFDVLTEAPDFNVRSDFLLYFQDEQKAIFLGEPIFDSEFATAEAEEMQIFFSEQEIKLAELNQSCEVRFSSEAGGERDNWIKSNAMSFDFVEGQIKICDAEGEVSSFYQQEKSEKDDFLINRAAAAKMKIIFANEEIEEIFLQDKIDGVYKFER
ncbi:MAG: LptA/OstA family protein [Candidatus Cloacimonadales bacterium]